MCGKKRKQACDQSRSQTALESNVAISVLIVDHTEPPHPHRRHLFSIWPLHCLTLSYKFIQQGVVGMGWVYVVPVYGITRYAQSPY